MRRMMWLVVLGCASYAGAAMPNALTFDDVVQRRKDDPLLLARRADVARMQREVATTGRFTNEGPTLSAESGPRRLETGATRPDVSARLEVPLLTGRRTRAQADARLRDASPELLAEAAVESRLRLRTAFLDAWLQQELLAVSDAQAAAVERTLAAVRQHVAAGAEAPYEVALVEGELLRAQSQSDAARTALGEAWCRLRALADLPPTPQPLASPGLPDLQLADDADSRFAAGAMRQAIEQRRSVDVAFVEFDEARRRSRWSVAGTLAREGEESFTLVGAGYRFPLRGEVQARERDRAATLAALARGADVEIQRLTTRFRTAVERAQRFGPLAEPAAFDDALRAIDLRLELGKERPSQALPVRRQILEARAAASQRIRDAQLLLAEIEALTSGDAP